MSTLSLIQLQLNHQLEPYKLDPLARHCLELFIVDPHGIEQAATASMLAGATGDTLEMCSDVLQVLLGHRLLVFRDGRVEANFELLGIDEATKAVLQTHTEPLRSIGSPHSPSAMESLKEWLIAHDGIVYLGMGITSHRVFQEALQSRAHAGRTTVTWFNESGHSS
ncbi:hypothetical protein [Nitrosomonas sp. Nm58]|uniref:hypothetical protein n=1 Tax=Nitrosomonas sp. Nm58 TaxID=200126 RepID=UPI00089AAEEF|nr:hypothetical protein [Nitrosomonas sp. Nm58]SDZ13839.1 hypothetical protein SAMN05421754_107010 [Nitrosomonas sp. Nm58]